MDRLVRIENQIIGITGVDPVIQVSRESEDGGRSWYVYVKIPLPCASKYDGHDDPSLMENGRGLEEVMDRVEARIPALITDYRRIVS